MRHLISTVAVLALVTLLAFTTCRPALAQTCGNDVVVSDNGIPKTFTKCLTLPHLESSIAWNYNPTSFLFEFAFQSTMTSAGGWVGWGFNPTSPRMDGGNVLVAFSSSTNGSNLRPFNLLLSGPQSVNTADFNLVENSTTVLIVPADLKVTFSGTLKLKENQVTLNQIWNRGDSVSNFAPLQHALSGNNLLSAGTLDLLNGGATSAGLPHQDFKNNHGIINAIAWGLLFPLGVMAARYMRPFAIFDPLWFYLHVSCQVTAYILGVVGWGMGLKLETYSSNIKYKHKNLGIALFVLATLQITALALRPNKEHKLRKYWNVYHHSCGFALIIISIVNVFEGIDILQPAKGWKTAYIVILCTIAVVALILEIFTWIAWYMKRSQGPADKLGGEEGYINGKPQVYGFNTSDHQQWVREPQL